VYYSVTNKNENKQFKHFANPCQSFGLLHQTIAALPQEIHSDANSEDLTVTI